MIIITLIATIIHMNMGFTMPEALGRGVISALLVGLLGIVVQGIIMLVMYLAGRR